ncbi:hypothetical protein [Bdellovibrio sp. NC01]|uniref:hypothetical protein n=1 Tax=Bdellovibrio sp. NC01 TaxID=2220073 RepID=UPI00115B537F|nr:hypothetical protein [Bdellovibrio sp. NC01]QDK37178.1 hypothetical protein DOE51_06025 [Bdellovibrio sp. NC01]
MPDIRNYEGKKKSKENHHGKHHNKHAKRRLHQEADHGEEITDDTEINEQTADIMAESGKNNNAMNEENDAINTEAQNEGVHASSGNHQGSTNAESTFQAQKEMINEGAPADGQGDKVHLHFYGSEVIREKAPKVMEIADTVADEWVKDGQFEGLPLGNPLAQMAAAKVLRKAKDVEKKLEEKGVFAMAKMGLEYAKSEIEKRKKH